MPPLPSFIIGQLTLTKCALLTVAFALLTAAPRLKAVVSIFDALMTSVPTLVVHHHFVSGDLVMCLFEFNDLAAYIKQ